jgi:hypothetical protein
LTKSGLTVAQQANLIRQVIPDARSRFRRGELIAVVSLQPTAQSSTYAVEISYRPGSPPTVRVLQPALQPRPGSAGLPHVYTGDQLCLNLPGDWNPVMSIGETIIPWAAEWLLHYEIWLACGEWTGGGVHSPKDT